MVVGDASLEIDVLVIGGGPGGYVAAIRAAQLGKRVIIAERGKWGGVCLNVGCIPSKALIQAAHQYEAMRNAERFGLLADNIRADFAKVQEYKESVVSRMSCGVEALLKANGVQMFQGEAMFINDREARLFNDREAPRYRFGHCIVATGSRPVELKGFPFGGRILSSTEALSLREVPKHLVVIGGGYIGVELGQMYAKFGAKVTILEAADTILPGFDPDLTRLVAKRLAGSGAQVVTKAKALGAEQNEREVTVTYEAEGKTERVTADYLLVTVGRRPNTDGDFGLELAGVKTGDRGLIEVDEQCRTSNPHIFAIGDVVPGPALAHKASYEGKVAAEAIAGLPAKVDYKCIPAVVFADPECASVGYTEQEAKEKGFDAVSGKFPYSANGRAVTLGEAEGFVKLVADRETGLLLGAQIAGAEASNLISGFALAIEMGATLEDIALTIHPHPTLGEMAMDAAELVLGRPIHVPPAKT